MEKDKEKQKINLYVPEDTALVLENDARYFEIFKKTGNVNRNLFLSRVLSGIYFESVIDSITGSDEILKTNKKMVTYDWALKETDYNSDIIQSIIDKADSLKIDKAALIRGMLRLYCREPMYRREQIVFNDIYIGLCNACKNKETIAIKYKWKKGFYNVIPYTITVGKEEMFNYFLCVERYNGKQVTKSYRLNRVESLKQNHQKYDIENNVENYLKLMIKYGPQYSINGDIDICVELTEEGVRKYNRIYQGRPFIRKDQHDIKVGENYFTCSQDQAFIYFRKFGKDAIVISPDLLKEKMIRFFTEAYNAYNVGGDFDE